MACQGVGDLRGLGLRQTAMPGEELLDVARRVPAKHTSIAQHQLARREHGCAVVAHCAVACVETVVFENEGEQLQQVFRLLRRLHDELKVNTTCGASNVSFGLPNRNHITSTFLAMAISNGMTSAILNPLHEEVKTAVMAADVLAGNDQDCFAWIRANREPQAEGAGRERRGGRRRG